MVTAAARGARSRARAALRLHMGASGAGSASPASLIPCLTSLAQSPFGLPAGAGWARGCARLAVLGSRGGSVQSGLLRRHPLQHHLAGREGAPGLRVRSTMPAHALLPGDRLRHCD
eukprot:scaffold2611_cov114-Isochrysis_galbana.AAC.11